MHLALTSGPTGCTKGSGAVPIGRVGDHAPSPVARTLKPSVKASSKWSTSKDTSACKRTGEKRDL